MSLKPRSPLSAPCYNRAGLRYVNLHSVICFAPDPLIIMLYVTDKAKSSFLLSGIMKTFRRISVKLLFIE